MEKYSTKDILKAGLIITISILLASLIFFIAKQIVIKNDLIVHPVSEKLIEGKVKKQILKKEKAEIKQRIVELEKIDTVYIDRWHKTIVYSQQAPDTCKPYIDSLTNACNAAIDHLSEMINEFKLQAKIDSAIAVQDSTDIETQYHIMDSLCKKVDALTLKLESANAKKKWWQKLAALEAVYIILRETIIKFDN